MVGQAVDSIEEYLSQIRQFPFCHARRNFRFPGALTAQEQEVLRLRYGLVDGCPRTLKEVGKSFSLSSEQIRQVEASALAKLQPPACLPKLVGFLDCPEEALSRCPWKRVARRESLQQELARHSDIRLTMRVYSHIGSQDKARAIGRLGGRGAERRSDTGEGRFRRTGIRIAHDAVGHSASSTGMSRREDLACHAVGRR